jgi:hypothetical protein
LSKVPDKSGLCQKWPSVLFTRLEIFLCSDHIPKAEGAILMKKLIMISALFGVLVSPAQAADTDWAAAKSIYEFGVKKYEPDENAVCAGVWSAWGDVTEKMTEAAKSTMGSDLSNKVKSAVSSSIWMDKMPDTDEAMELYEEAYAYYSVMGDYVLDGDVERGRELFETMGACAVSKA